MSEAWKTHRARLVLAALGVVLGTGAAAAVMSPQQKVIFEKYLGLAKTGDAGFKDFSAERGKTLFLGRHAGGKVDTPSCTTCHTADPAKPGRTRAGKEIAPMAASVNAKRFTDPAEVEKWFKRNCSDVLGRECTVVEKGDVLVYLLGL
jgi:hypothetical protein